MKLALAIGIGFLLALAGMALAHQHPAPNTCAEICEDLNCRCWERNCGDAGEVPNSCTVQCNWNRDNCLEGCQGAGT